MTLPGFIAPPKEKKARAVKPKAAPAAGKIQPEQHTSDNTNAATAVQTASDAKSAAATSNAQTVRKADTRSRKTAKRRRDGYEAEGLRGEGLQSVDLVERQATVEILRGLASRPQVLDLMEQVQPGAIHGAVKAMLGGAVVAGAHGAADRASMWRVLGMPWVGEGGNAKQAGTLLGAVLGEAVARLEGHRGRVPVTLDATTDAKTLTDNAD